MMLHTKYQGSKPYDFRQEDFSMYSPIKPVKNMSPLGQGHFWPQGDNLNKLGRGPLGCYIPNIKALVLVVSEKKLFF